MACGVAAAVVDARSTWIPRQLCWAGWALGVPAAAAALLLGTGRPQLLAAATGAVAAAALFWLAWRISRGGIGFADVRIAPLVGLAAGSLGPLGWWWSLLLGTALGAVVALLRRTLGRPGPTPYAPALVAGPFLAALLAPLAG
nr:prepilin peptidase [Auraticoccus cholistanensis]